MRFPLLIIIFLTACSSEKKTDLSSYNVPKGKTLEIIAEEPMLNAPVALDFDEHGRIWVLEMPAYMPNIEGTGESEAINAIKILSDTDNDGLIDSSHTFLDGLVLPRTICLAYGGLIYAEPPNLWFVEINESKPGNRTLIDSTYAVDGNVEHMPNSLTWNMDNWLYSSSSNTRYKRKEGKWLKEFTTPRGQWGLTKDNYGRLIYNTNSLLLASDQILPNALFKNEFLKLQENNLQILTENQDVYPLQATAVNRGYQADVLDSLGLLQSATSACAPLYCRDKFVDDWQDCAFVALPEINSIKKLNLSRNGLSTFAAASDTTSEYLSATDEGFRPVHLKMGPDGNMYIVDMHRGIIQHKAYMTSYLREKILNTGLDKIREQGRILRLSSTDNELRSLAFNVEDDAMAFLYSKNSFLRDKAQHSIVYQNKKEFIPRLKENLKKNLGEINLLHTLWTLEGLDALTEYDLLDLLASNYVHLRYHVMHILSNRKKIVNKKWLLNIVNTFIERADPETDYAIASHLASLRLRGPIGLSRDYRRILLRNDTSRMFIEAILADSKDWSPQLLRSLKMRNDSSFHVFQDGLETMLLRKKRQNPVYYYNESLRLEDRRTVGMSLYIKHCSSCHGIDGEGKKDIAPPLLDSDFVSDRDEKLILVTLHGMTGPLTINGKKFEFNTGMAGLNDNNELDDADIKDILHYVRNAFNSAPYSITEDKVCHLRNFPPGKNEAFTEESLEQTLKEIDALGIFEEE